MEGWGNNWGICGLKLLKSGSFSILTHLQCMNISEIGRKVKLYYKEDQKALILSAGSEFRSDFEKAVALAFLNFSEFKPTITRLLKNESLVWHEVQELVESIPEMSSALPNPIYNYFIQILSHQEPQVQEFALGEFLNIFYQLNDQEQNKIKRYLNLEYQLILQSHLGNYQDLQEEVLTHPTPKERYEEIKAYAQNLGSTLIAYEKLIADNSISAQMINLSDLSFEVEQVKEEKENILRVFKNLLNRQQNKVNDYLKSLAPVLPETETLVSQFIEEVIFNDEGEKFKWVLTNKLSSANFEEELLRQQSWNCLNVLLALNPEKLNSVVEKFFAQAEVMGLEDWFISGMEKLQVQSLNSLTTLPIIQKIALKSSNYSQNKFYARIWDWLQEKLALNHFATGKHSFAQHYSNFYKDICELERFNLFYSLKDFQQYIQEVNIGKNTPIQYLHTVVEIILQRVKVINSVLSEDIKNKFNSLTQKILIPADLAVLSAYLEKMKTTQECLVKLDQLLKKDNVVLEQLFKTDTNAASFPNLKGFHLGELKVGGLENYQGHGKQIKEILAPFGILVSPEIKKEVDHFISVKSEHAIRLDLVESKNYKKVLTNQNPRMWEIKNQKNRLDKAIDQVKAESPSVKLEVLSKIILNRGLTTRSQSTLQKDDNRATAYSEAMGVIFNFDELAYVVNEETEKLCQLINKKKTFDKDLFADKIVAIANVIAMIEEDGDAPCSDPATGAGLKAKELFNICSKILSNKLNNSQYYRDVGHSIIGAYRGIVSQRESQV